MRDYKKERLDRKKSNEKYGLVRVTLTVPIEKVEAIKEICTGYTRRHKMRFKDVEIN